MTAILAADPEASDAALDMAAAYVLAESACATVAGLSDDPDSALDLLYALLMTALEEQRPLILENARRNAAPREERRLATVH